MKVLVVDDSALMRRLLGNLLREAGMTVETARHGAEAVERLSAFEPDVVTLDVNMPEMDGLTALSLMMQVRPTPTVMVSSLTERGAQVTFEALALGAVDYVAKPGGTISLSVDEIAAELLAKVRSAHRARLRPPRASSAARVTPARRGPAPVESPPAEPARARPSIRPPREPRATERDADGRRPAARAPSRMSRDDGTAGLVLIGVSTGGPRVLEDILPALPADLPWPVLVAQHMPASFTDTFARRLDKLCALRVREVDATVPLEAGWIYVARGGTDMVVTERIGRLVAQARPEVPGHPWHPSVDVLVDSARRLLPPERLLGVLLTGMGYDGAAAMSALHAEGGRTIAESEETAVVFGMPHELIERGGASVVLPSDRIAGQIAHWVTKQA